MNVQIEAGDLKMISRILQDHVLEGLVRFSEDGFRVVVPDPAQKVLLDVDIDPDFFDSYEVDPEEYGDNYLDEYDAVVVGLNFEVLYTILKKFKSDDLLSLEVDGNEFVINHGSDSLSQPVLALDPEDIPEVDNIGFDSKMSLDAQVFIDKIQKLVIMGDPITAEATEDSLDLSADGDLSSGFMSVPVDEFEGTESQAFYDDRELKKIAGSVKKVYDKDSNVSFSMGDDIPFTLRYDEENLKLRIFLAPRIKE